MFIGTWLVVSVQWSVVSESIVSDSDNSGQCLLVRGQWSVVSGQFTVVSFHCSVSQ